MRQMCIWLCVSMNAIRDNADFGKLFVSLIQQLLETLPYYCVALYIGIIILPPDVCISISPDR